MIIPPDFKSYPLQNVVINFGNQFDMIAVKKLKKADRSGQKWTKLTIQVNFYPRDCRILYKFFSGDKDRLTHEEY